MIAGGSHTFKFKDAFKMPSYLSSFRGAAGSNQKIN